MAYLDMLKKRLHFVSIPLPIINAVSFLSNSTLKKIDIDWTMN